MKRREHIGSRVLRILLTIAAYAYLAYILITYPDYAGLAEHFRTIGTIEWMCLLAALALVPVNMLCEAWKWQYLLRDLEPMTIGEAQRQTYYGTLGAFITPDRLGDYPTRVTRIADREKWLPAISLGFIGTFALMTVNISCGLLALCLSGLTIGGISRGIVITVGCLLLVAFVTFIGFLPKIAGWCDRRVAQADGWRAQWHRTMGALAQFPVRRFPVVLAISACRYVVFSGQLILILLFSGIGLSTAQWLTAVPVYYLMVTILPALPIADAALRGSIGAWVFSAFTPSTAGVAIGAIILWIVNTIIPMLCGTFVKKRP